MRQYHICAAFPVVIAGCSVADRSAAGQACTEERALEAVKRAIVEDVDPDLVSYSVSVDSQHFVVVGSYRGPMIGFEPTARVARRSCDVVGIDWR
jgi:hypothetical protein